MSKIRILYVDDDAIHRMVVTQLTARQPNLEVVTTDSALDALNRMAKGQNFDALLVDWNMPEMSGYKLVCALRANPQFKKLRIMMVTVKNSPGRVKQALNAGVDEYLMKPLTRESLLSKLELLMFN